MLATFFNSPLKRHFVAAMLALAGIELLVCGALLYALAAGRLSWPRPFLSDGR